MAKYFLRRMFRHQFFFIIFAETKNVNHKKQITMLEYINVFKDTMSCCNDNKILSNAVAQSVKSQRVIH